MSYSTLNLESNSRNFKTNTAKQVWSNEEEEPQQGPTYGDLTIQIEYDRTTAQANAAADYKTVCISNVSSSKGTDDETAGATSSTDNKEESSENETTN